MRDAKVLPGDHGHYIQQYMHCGMCLDEKPSDVSARDYARVEIGWTEWGFQVWCTRHHVNICHVNFEGVKHKADTCARAPKDGN